METNLALLREAQRQVNNLRYPDTRTLQHNIQEVSLPGASVQLRLLENSADAMMTALGAVPTGPRNAPAQAVMDAQKALNSYQDTLEKLQPLLDSVSAASGTPLSNLSVAAIDAAWVKESPPQGTAAINSTPAQTVHIPQLPCTTLDSLSTTLKTHLGIIIQVEESSFGASPGAAEGVALLVQYDDVMVARVALQSWKTMWPVEVIVTPLVAASKRIKKAASPAPAFYQRLTAEATAAMFAFCALDEQARKGASPLELLLVWLWTCLNALRKGANTAATSPLKLDPASGSLILECQSNFTEAHGGWRQVWEAAAGMVSI